MTEDLNTNKGIALFEQQEIRKEWHNERWYFAVVDIVAALTQSDNPQVYWRVFKKRLIDEGSNETVTKCNALKMITKDGKKRLTDAADLETVFRIIQSIPSPKAEPLKIWLAHIAIERINEIQDPELAVNRAKDIEKQTGNRVVSKRNFHGDEKPTLDELSEELLKPIKPKLLPQKPLDVSPKAHHYDD